MQRLSRRRPRTGGLGKKRGRLSGRPPKGWSFELRSEADPDPEANAASWSANQVGVATGEGIGLGEASLVVESAGILDKRVDAGEVGMVENVQHTHMPPHGDALTQLDDLEESEVGSV